MKITRRRLETMPFAKVFETSDGNEQLCNATGYEECFGDINNPGDWWNEYEDINGNLYYGR